MRIGKTNAIFGSGGGGGGEVVVNFKPFVAPESFDHPSKYADFGCTVNIYEKFRAYKMTHPNADVAVELSDAIWSLNLSNWQMPTGSTIEVFETISGVETSVLYTTGGQHIFTAGSAKRYMIRRVNAVMGFLFPVGSVWAYCIGIPVLSIEASNNYLKYIFLHDEHILTNVYFHDTTIEGTLRINGEVTAIIPESFSKCKNLTKVIIGDNVESIQGVNAQGAFQRCTSLQVADLGDGIISIGEDSFRECTSLASIICRAYTPPTLWPNAFNLIPETTNFYVPHERVNAYKAADGWAEFESRIYSINDL